eukprot:COSAG03_NODE_25669_length_264_cov_0.630303_1_plen_53_part_10
MTVALVLLSMQTLSVPMGTKEPHSPPYALFQGRTLSQVVGRRFAQDQLLSQKD